jgi:glycosyltransferase involved in cell wall biosynthesis
VPTVVALRNLNIYDRRYYDTPRLRTLFHLARLGARRARRVIFPSRAAAEQIRAVVPIPEERVAVVPYGICPEMFDSGPEPPSGPPYLFVPASLQRHKNLEVAIRALRWIADPDLEIRIAGESETDPSYARSLRELAERTGAASRVKFLGAVPYQEMPALYWGATAMVFPSLLETFGHPLLEAMAAGIPILTSDIPTIREIAGDVAHYFPGSDPGALARAVNGLRADSTELAERIARGRARAASFSWRRSADLLCSTFEQALRDD